jgi:DNA repair photolyase
VSTYAFLGPILQIVTEKTLIQLVDEIVRVNPDYVLVDRLNIKYGNWNLILKVLKKYYSEDIKFWKSVLFNDSTYYKIIKTNISNIFNESGLTYHFCY